MDEIVKPNGVIDGCPTALALGAESVPEWSAQERELVAAVSPPRPSRRMLAALREQITLLYALVTGLLLASMFRRTEGSR